MSQAVPEEGIEAQAEERAKPVDFSQLPDYPRQ